MVKTELIDWIREIERDEAVTAEQLFDLSEEELSRRLDDLIAACDQDEPAVSG